MITLIIVLIGTVLFVNFALWVVHVSMMLSEKCEWSCASFKTFLKEYNKYDGWERDELWSFSHFGGTLSSAGRNKYYIHAGIIKFNDKGMLLYPHSHFMYLIWLITNRLVTPSNYKKDLWNEEQL